MENFSRELNETMDLAARSKRLSIYENASLPGSVFEYSNI